MGLSPESEGVERVGNSSSVSLMLLLRCRWVDMPGERRYWGGGRRAGKGGNDRNGHIDATRFCRFRSPARKH